ncbi:MAG TPA: hypothetical protein VNO30_06660 [Kofleriaceae bacterium]|nr:hypothetical protein [Kofleriaceae bacterium]
MRLDERPQPIPVELYHQRMVHHRHRIAILQMRRVVGARRIGTAT